MRLLPLLSGLLLLSTVAVAQPGPDPSQAPPPADQSAPPPPDQAPPPPEQAPPPPAHMNFAQRFHAANTTNDGHLTRDQAQAGGLTGVAKHFDQIDAEHKGFVTFQDIRTWRQAMHQGHLGHGAPPPPPAPPPQ